MIFMENVINLCYRGDSISFGGEMFKFNKKESERIHMKNEAISICFPARKGGVGKTMIAGNVAACLANDGYRVLLICADSQEDVSEKYLSSLEEFDIDEHNSLTDLLNGNCSIEECVVTTPMYRGYNNTIGKKIKRRLNGEYYSFDIIPAGTEIDEWRGEDLWAIKNIVDQVKNDYDFVLFDTPPAETEVVMLVYMAADYGVVPVSDQASFRSLQMTMNNFDLARENGSEIECIGMVVNNAHASRKLDKFNEGVFRDNIGDLVFDTVIRASSSIPNADAFSTPLCSFGQTTSGHEDFLRFYEELKERIAQHEEVR